MCGRFTHKDLTAEENARAAATNQANAVMPSVEEDEVKSAFSQPITNLILCHCQGRPLMSKRPFKPINLTKPPMNISRHGQWILGNFNTTIVLTTLG